MKNEEEKASEDYEIVPLSPIRRLEKRIEKLEKLGSETWVLNLIRTNQKIVDDLVRVNTELLSKISVLVSEMQQLTKNLEKFLKNVEVVSEETEKEEEKEKETETKSELEKRIAKLERRINALLLSRIPKSKWETIRRSKASAQPAMPNQASV